MAYHARMTGFFVHRDSHLENLAQRLITALRGKRPANPLAAQTVVVAHPGLGRWLERLLAHKDGIAANYRLVQPWQWLDDAARHALGEAQSNDRDWRADSLRWKLFALLPQIEHAAVRASLSGDDAQRRRFQLAQRLAAIYTQYLIYRPDWIAAWEHGDSADWQAALWRKLRKAIAAPHRAQRQHALLEALVRTGDGKLEPLHVFGVSHLPPDALDALIAVSRVRAVHLYLPDPCREYWADMISVRARLERNDDADDVYFEVGHPLLVSLGRMTQDFLLALDARGIDYATDEESESPPAPTNLLGALQASLRDGRPDCMARVSAQRTDASLRVHACATRLRELEVLRDSLLDFLSTHDDLKHQDIVVMAPDIGAYAPYLPAVFGERARYRDDAAHIPWHLADVSLASTHPLLRAFGQLLDLAESRFGLREVLDLLDVPAIARRANLHADERDALENGLRRAGVAWGLDAQSKQRAGAAAVAANSWEFGFDRLYAGLIIGADDEDRLLDGILPLAGLGSADAAALGRLHRLLDNLRRLSTGFGTERPLVKWCEWLQKNVEELFEIDANDAAEMAAASALRQVFAELREQAPACGDQALPWSVVREALRDALAAVPERQPFLLGGVTFCGLVPQRSIPFRVVCLVGMNEGEFPRASVDEGLNEMHRQRRRGDRDTRREDRNLFLEALMAARQYLHVSYLGSDAITGKARNPAAPLGELLQFLDAQVALAEDAKAPWRIEHALQPWGARYFDGSDAALFSYAQHFAQRAAVLDAPPAFVDWSQTAAQIEPVAHMRLESLKRFWRDPAKVQLRDTAGVSLDVLDADENVDREPLESRTDRRERVESQLLFAALAQGCDALPDSAPNWLAHSGKLAGGAIGASAYARAREQAQLALVQARGVLGGGVRRASQFVEFDCNGVRVVGVVHDVFCAADGQLHLLGARINRKADLRDLLAFYLDWACLTLGGIAVQQAHFFEVDKDADKASTPRALTGILDQSPAQLRAGVAALMELVCNAPAQPVLFPPRTADAWLAAKAEDCVVKASKQWEGDDYSRGERCYEPSYASLLTRNADFLDASTPAGRSFAAVCERIAGILDPDRSAGGAP